MINFKRTELTDIEEFRKFLPQKDNLCCDSTSGGIFMWFDNFETHHAIIDSTLIQRISSSDGTMFAVPYGNNVIGAIFSIYEYCRENGIPCKFYGATDTFKNTLSSLFRIEEVYERDICEYIYFSDDLSTFAGKKYHGQKNHLNAFKKLYPDAYAKEIHTDDIEDIKNFLIKYKASAVKNTPSFLGEITAVERVLNNYSLYGFEGIAVYNDNEVISFAVGEFSGNTMFVHIEKALTEYRGLYQYTVSSLALFSRQKGAVYMNREDDTGDEGLRISKLSYKPCRLLDKYTITVKEVKLK